MKTLNKFHKGQLIKRKNNPNDPSKNDNKTYKIVLEPTAMRILEKTGSTFYSYFDANNKMNPNTYGPFMNSGVIWYSTKTDMEDDFIAYSNKDK